VTPEDLVSQVYIPERRGSLQIEMLAAARRHGLVSYQLAPRFEDLLRELAAGHPVIVLQNLGIGEGWHYAVAVGYDYDSGELILRSGTTQRQVLPFTVHEMVWKRSGYWAMVALPPQRIPATADEQRWLGAIAAVERAANPAPARAAYAKFLERWPQNVNAAVGLANAHHALGALPEAERVLRGALELAPDSVIVLNNLAQTLSDQGKHAEALPYIERAVERTAAAGGRLAPAVQETRETIRKRLAGN
jgi:tetratricopeptide (TPR) repeat protein